MTHDFDKGYWEQHWAQSHGAASSDFEGNAPNPYLARETAGLMPDTALDAGCGTGGEAIWLAAHGWRVTAADISAIALDRASEHAAVASVSDTVTWVEADLTSWEPGRQFDLVVTSYAHPAMAQLAFYARISEWVAPGGTLLIVGHRNDHASTGHSQRPPANAAVTLSDITEVLDPTAWRIETAEEKTRTLAVPGGRSLRLHDVIVRATRRR
ncbi:MAG: SAM-dependent methyltransferase [Microbacteriaceae bacterium]|nr:SAM-dependent methyltransferase [Microbacteriaceae bacterium]